MTQASAERRSEVTMTHTSSSRLLLLAVLLVVASSGCAHQPASALPGAPYACAYDSGAFVERVASSGAKRCG